MQPRLSSEPWSGEATRNQGFAVEEARVDVTIGDAEVNDVIKQKDRPVWMTESTVVSNDLNSAETSESILHKAAQSSSTQPATMFSSSSRNKKENEDIMSVLLQHEKQQGQNAGNSAAKGLAVGNSSDSSDDDREIENTEIRKISFFKSDYLISTKIYNFYCCF